ncbi:TPR repeat-containing protein [Plasmopara halstedii]|uniref:TPR repeat-containing protein n=1 Tax=Plasmopara halstedii TaxID=4781 RepID=A0A0P1ASB1_PLAHL|nr:TPR repeat-containing protein [Plasmopara halstedii]CEG44744.1 TPR repeat-containing protein [Plasmopara halstedii]|eukprot:XP_024581113.1 TPR repeat-containing protein [Plasmopara halstedii]
MEWLFGSTTRAAPSINAKLSASTAQGRSAPSSEDDSRHKNRGNDFFKSKDFEAAIREYSLGIEQKATATLHSNRSAAYCALGQYQLAKADADAAIKLDPEWAKTYSRKGKALYGMASYKKAADAYARGLELCLRGALGEAQTREIELEALKRQTDSQAEAYLRLLEENNQLKRQLEDYQHMFGEWTKKEM